jgi:branched-chain amino acid transport system ATP-binding protein
MLTLSGVHTFYGHIEALKGIDVDVKKGEIVTLIGSNGAGKSTLLMTICGSPQARMGTVMFDGRDITRMPTHMITRAGISQSPEGRRIFPRMTVLENLQMGALLGDPAHFPQDLEMARICSRSYARARPSAAAPCRAGSSRCWRSPAR